MRVAVYFNRHNKEWSVAEYKSRRCYGKKLSSAVSLLLKNTDCVVRETARQRVIESQRRGVHAWITGELVESNMDQPSWMNPVAISYNPFKCGWFHFIGSDLGCAVNGADEMYFAPDGRVYVGSKTMVDMTMGLTP